MKDQIQRRCGVSLKLEISRNHRDLLILKTSNKATIRNGRASSNPTGIPQVKSSMSDLLAPIWRSKMPDSAADS